MPKWRRIFPSDFAPRNGEIIDLENENLIEGREEPLPICWQIIEGKIPLVQNYSLNLLKTHYSTLDEKQVICIEWNSLVFIFFKLILKILISVGSHFIADRE
jgi:hypothetical protein